jgi:hypothetical protein
MPIMPVDYVQNAYIPAVGIVRAGFWRGLVISDIVKPFPHYMLSLLVESGNKTTFTLANVINLIVGFSP